MRYLVTGAGMLGSALATRLREEGHDVRVFDVLAADGVDIVGDVAVVEDIRPAVAGTDGVFHTASIHGWRDAPPQDFLRTNVIGMWNLCEAMVGEGVTKLVHSSTVGVYNTGGRVEIDESTPADGEVTDVYDLSKRFQEGVCRHFAAAGGLQYVCLRYGGFRQLIEQTFGRLTKEWAASGAVVDLEDAVTANTNAMQRLPLPKPAYVVIPSGGTKSSAYSVDAGRTETDLGFRFQSTYEDFVELAR